MQICFFELLFTNRALIDLWCFYYLFHSLLFCFQSFLIKLVSLTVVPLFVSLTSFLLIFPFGKFSSLQKIIISFDFFAFLGKIVYKEAQIVLNTFYFTRISISLSCRKIYKADLEIYSKKRRGFRTLLFLNLFNAIL